MGKEHDTHLSSRYFERCFHRRQVSTIHLEYLADNAEVTANVCVELDGTERAMGMIHARKNKRRVCSFEACHRVIYIEFSARMVRVSRVKNRSIPGALPSLHLRECPTLSPLSVCAHEARETTAMNMPLRDPGNPNDPMSAVYTPQRTSETLSPGPTIDSSDTTPCALLRMNVLVTGTSLASRDRYLQRIHHHIDGA